MQIIVSFLQQLVLHYYLEKKSVENITLGNVSSYLKDLPGNFQGTE